MLFLIIKSCFCSSVIEEKTSKNKLYFLESRKEKSKNREI